MIYKGEIKRVAQESCRNLKLHVWKKWKTINGKGKEGAAKNNHQVYDLEIENPLIL